MYNPYTRVWKLQAHFIYVGIFYFAFLQYYFLHKKAWSFQYKAIL